MTSIAEYVWAAAARNARRKKACRLHVTMISDTSGAGVGQENKSSMNNCVKADPMQTLNPYM
jgi:hypothetical protein